MNRLKHWIKGDLRDLYWGIYGKTIKNPRLPAKPRAFLFVCKGNICRSPFAERLAIRIAKNKGFKEIAFYSAGLEVSKSLPSPKEAILTAESFGVHLDDHKSRKMT